MYIRKLYAGHIMCRHTFPTRLQDGYFFSIYYFPTFETFHHAIFDKHDFRYVCVGPIFFFAYLRVNGIWQEAKQ